MRGSLRLLTAAALIAVAAFSVSRGYAILHFSLESMNAESAEQRAEIVGRWGATPGLASMALHAGLAEQLNIADQEATNRQREALIAVLSNKPLSAREWLSLSGVQLVTDQPMDDVLESLKMSTLTGPNEGTVMVDRGIYGVSLWGSLSPDLKSRVANDLLVTLFPRTPDEGKQGGKLRALVAAQPERVRKELRAELLATGLPASEIEQRLGI